MHKILLIAKREFLSRVQKKTFLLTTILLPLFIFILYALIIYFSISSDENITIAVADEAHLFQQPLQGDNHIFFLMSNEPKDSLIHKTQKGIYSGYVFIPAQASLYDTLQLVTEKKLGLLNREKIEELINNQLSKQRLLSLQLSPGLLDSLQHPAMLQFNTLQNESSSSVREGINYAIGYISGFAIYIILFVYGTMVMRGVMEEKVNRIAEVMVSSVKPFQLMLGKISGIGAVGLVQFLIWVVLIVGFSFLLPLFFPSIAQEMQHQPIQPAGMQAAETFKNVSENSSFLQELSQIQFGVIFSYFLIYFLGGYLLYSSLFAAVGSSVNEDPQDAQSLLLPITMPIILGIVLMTKAVNEPSSGLAIFGSLFPLTSPIVMMGRIGYGIPETVPYWQLVVSILLLIGGFLFTTWLAAKIYRTGILMYGKKPSWKEMIKWAFK
jgi:ABC-2 type transport system permease protein